MKFRAENKWVSGMVIFLSALLFVALSVPVSNAQITSTLEGTAKDNQGLPIAGVRIKVSSTQMGVAREVITDSDGRYRVAALAPGIYEAEASKNGFESQALKNLEVTLNRTLVLDFILRVGAVNQTVEVNSALPLLETTDSSSGTTITPDQIQQMPINGRNYLDLLQLVPGVALNRQVDSSLDGAVPILGERGGNTVFLIDGLPNRDETNGGAASQFNQDSILEFQVVTAGYKAEFGHGSGGIVNVVSKSGTNDWHGAVSFYHRNYKLDSSDVPKKDTPFLLRWDPSVQLGGPIMKDRIFFFGSAERILESRDLNFQFPAGTPDILVQLETPFNLHTKLYDSRYRLKLDEVWGHHRFSESMNYTNTHVTDFLPLTAAFNLPSTRGNTDSSRLMTGVSDLATLGDQSNPFLFNAYVQYRREPTLNSPSHPEAGLASTLDNLFSSLTTGQLFGDLGQVQFGPGHSPLLLRQDYISAGASLAKQLNRHNVKFGWDFQHTKVDGTEANNLFNQLFGLESDLGTFGPIDSGLDLLIQQGGLTPQDNLIRLRNNYNGLFVQDDWKIRQNFNVNAGLRWDYDTGFPNKKNFSPRLGFAWSITPKTVLNASFGYFYDHFREGLARDIPGFGGANIKSQTFVSFPRLFYGNPSSLVNIIQGLGLDIPCLSSNLTDAQIAAMGATCPNGAGFPFYGIDHLNNVVAAGHAPIPAGTAINMGNAQSLTGFTPQQFADAAGAAIGEEPGYFSYDTFGNLTVGSSVFGTAGQIPITVDPNFRTPYTRSYHVGLQREITDNFVVQADYYHKQIRDLLGVRATNLAFEARIDNSGKLQPGTGKSIIESYGPWHQGEYDGITVGFIKRMSKRFTLSGNYTYTKETDNALNSNFVTDLQEGLGASFTAINGPTDSFVGVPPVVTDPGNIASGGKCPGGTNANGPFVACNGNPVPQAGKFYNGPDLDKGPSDLALTHTFLLHGLVQLPWKFDLASIFRAQSGFHYSAIAGASADVDGDGIFNGIDFTKGRNHFVSPPFANMDLRIAKHFAFKEHMKLHLYFEFYNLFNRDNPAAIQGNPTLPPPSTVPPFGAVLQVLPGREGQVGIRFEF